MDEIDFLKQRQDNFASDSESLGKLIENLEKVISMAVHLSSRIDVLEARLTYLLSKDQEYVAALNKAIEAQEAEAKQGTEPNEV
jgi:hypothetical protein